jgi:hypothetical protein
MSTRAGLVPRLGGTAVEILESLYQHRLLSTSQIRELHTPESSLRWCQRLLADLDAAGLAEAVRLPGGARLHFLTARGADAVETIPSRGELRRKVVKREQAAGPLQQHTLAVNEVGLAFVRSARLLGDECPPLAWQHEVAHPMSSGRRARKGELLIADAVMTYSSQAGDQFSTEYRFIEVDRGTMTTDALAQKISAYARLAAYRPAKASATAAPLWRSRYPVWPGVLIVLAHRPRAQLERRAAVTLGIATADPVVGQHLTRVVSICLLEDLLEQGPEAPIFRFFGQDGPRVGWRPTYEPGGAS